MSTMYLKHHGILGQKWGKRNGPPYPLGGGDYTKLERKKILNKRRTAANTIYNKRHYDEVLDANKTTLSTVSVNPNRTKNTDMFYAAHTKLDTNMYNGFFNSKMPGPVFDEKGRYIGTGKCFKFSIKNKLKNNVKVASEDSAADIFSELYKKDRDFYNFVTDEKRMQSYFDDKRYGYKGYRESKDAIEKIRKGKDVTSEDLQKAYRMFNYVIPYDGAGKDNRGARDVVVQRTKFFNEAKKKGYGALLDTNDAIYGRMNARSPVIMFDMDSVVPNTVYRETASSVNKSRMVSVVRKILNANGIKV